VVVGDDRLGTGQWQWAGGGSRRERELYRQRMWDGCNLALERSSLKIRMTTKVAGNRDRLGGGLSCPEKDRCTNYSCTGCFLRVFREWISGFHDRLRMRPCSLFMLFILRSSFIRYLILILKCNTKTFMHLADSKLSIITVTKWWKITNTTNILHTYHSFIYGICGLVREDTCRQTWNNLHNSSLEACLQHIVIDVDILTLSEENNSKILI
jgi:hypothetical protein